MMQFHTRNAQRFLRAFALEGIAFFTWLILIPSDNRESGLFGYTPARLGMMASILLLSLGFWILGNKLKKQKSFLNLFHEKLSNKGKKLFVFSLATIFTSTIFFELQWLFLAEDEFLSAYLQRLSPLVGYLGILSIQILYFLYSQLKSNSEKWKLSALLLGTLALVPWMLIGEYFAAQFAFPAYYVVDGFHTKYQAALLFALFSTTIYFQFLIIGFSKHTSKKISITWLFISLFTVLGIFYYQATSEHATTINSSFRTSDQNAYMEITEKAVETNFRYTGTRSQMPLYPYVQALFYRSDMGENALFAQGKTLNIILSLLLLGGIFGIAKAFFPLRRTAIITLISTVSLFIFKAPYFQSELLYYFLSFLGFLGIAKMLVKPTLKLGGLTGLVLGLAQLTKASILPTMLAFSAVFLLQQGILFLFEKRVDKKEKCKKVKTATTSFVITLLSFTLVLLPYLTESKEKYGHYFYNVNSTFYIWYDSWDEAVTDTAKYGYREHYPNLPPDEIPNLKNYLREHSIKQISTRFFTGLNTELILILYPYSKINYLFLYGILLVILFIQKHNMQIIKRLLLQYWAVIIFTVLFVTGYLTLYAWYSPFAGGTRFLYSLFLPTLFSIFIALDKISKTLHHNQVLSAIKQHNMLDTIALALLIADFYYVTSIKLPAGYFGS